MENSNVIIKIIKGGQKNYITKLQPNSFTYKPSNKPFNDPEVLKFEPEIALKIADKLNSSFYGLSVVDINGKEIYHRFDKILKEEIQKFLINESYIMAGDNFNFKQPVQKVFFYNYSSFSTDYDVDVTESNISVTWQVSFWLNDMGIENFIIDIQKVEGVYVMELYDQKTDEMKQKSQKNIADEEWKFVVDEETTLVLGKTLYVKDLEFDFKSKTCRVNFQ